MKYCGECGHPVERKIPEGDNRSRDICTNCGFIHYTNPKIVAGTIPIWKNQVLLCRRAIEPRLGYWTLPAGFMENAESTAEAAIRETWEEALARVSIQNLYTVISVPHIDQVHIFFRAVMVNGEFGAGPESMETKLFSEADIPWDEISFPTVKQTLEQYFKDRREAAFPVHVSDIRRPLKTP
jgi:ADP-ribose pyrophosphatase YjhB (NUDIX family)